MSAAGRRIGQMLNPEIALRTLAETWSGKECPYQDGCTCRSGPWCRMAVAKQARGRHYPRLCLQGCPDAPSHCSCRLLIQLEVLASDYLRHSGIVEPPVPIDVIRLFDPQRPVEVRPLSMKAHHGCVWFLGDEWVLHLNARDPAPVQRYTAFHEGFHILTHNSGVSFSRIGLAHQAFSERLADYFAASILMPREWVSKAWPRMRSGERMARLFGVPPQAVRHWLHRLLSPYSLTCSPGPGQPEATTLW